MGVDRLDDGGPAVSEHTCTWCGVATANLTPAEGQRLCRACTHAYLDEAAGDRIAAYYGEQYRHARGADLPVRVGARP